MSDRAAGALRTAYLVASLAGVAFFVLSVTLLGVWPARLLDEQTRSMAPEHPLEPTISERRGRAVYAREGCAYCHTQQIRYLHRDMTRFGAPTLAWETRRDTPHLWGTRRVGPDLSRAGGTRSLDWHYAHLYSPRALVRESVMPGYPALFDGAPTRPRQEARDLVAYLESLGRARELAGPEGKARARTGCHCADDAMQQMAFDGGVSALNRHPAKARRAATAPPPLLNAGADRTVGLNLYARHCATCHGDAGRGDGPGAPMLLPLPTNLVEHTYSPQRLAEVLWNGVPGTAMPAWRDRSVADLSALALAVQALTQEGGDAAPGRSPLAEPVVPDYLVPLGARVYEANCVQCHGSAGDGNGTAAAALSMQPASFVRQRPSLSAAVRIVRNGVPGTPMAPWTPRLTDADVLAVASFVRSLYAPEAPGSARP